MDTLLLFITIFIFTYPFVDLFLLGKTISKLQKVAPKIDIYINKSNIQVNSIRSIITCMSPKLIKKYLTRKKEYYIYKLSYYFFIWYFFNGFIAITINIVILFIILQNLSGSKFEIHLVFCVINICTLWILKFSNIFHFWGLHKMAYAIDTIVYAILSPNGKINQYIYKISINTFLYLIDLVSFFIYFRSINNFINQYVYIDLLVVFVELIFFQYILGKVISICISKIFWKKGKDKQKFRDHKTSTIYYYELFKNTTYLVLLTIYIINKYVQILSQNITYNPILIEAIGALFLLDTFFEKNKTTNSYITLKHEPIKEKDQNLPLGESIMQAKTNNESSLNDHSSIPNIDISNTAIPEYLEVVKSEYQIERNKKQSFETRSGLLLTLLGAVLIFYFQSIKLTDIIFLFSQPLTFLLLIKILFGCSIYGSFIFTLISIIQTISAKKHDNFETNGITEKLLAENRLNALTRLIFTYRDIIVQHRISNEKRAKWYIASLRSMLILLISTIIYMSL